MNIIEIVTIKIGKGELKIDNYRLRINNIIRKYDDLLFKNPNIIGFGNGLKVINGKMTNQPSLTIYVREKFPVSMLSKDIIIPSYINGVITDIQGSGENILLKGPVKGGMSIGNQNNDFGGTVTYALSEIGEKADQKNIYLLSCNHILSRYDVEPKGASGINDMVIYPGKGFDKVIDENKSHSAVGVLKNIAPIYVEKNKAATKESPMDAAIAFVSANTGSFQLSLVTAGLVNGVNISDTAAVVAGQKIYFVGAVSGKKDCVVGTTAGTIRIMDKDNKTGNVYEIKYTNVTTVWGASDKGDSGSMGVVIDMSSKHKGFGMLVGGAPHSKGKDQPLTHFVDLRTALNYFKLDFLKYKEPYEK